VPASPLVRAAVAALVLLAIATAVGLAVLWPRDEMPQPAEGTSIPRPEIAEVTAVEVTECRVPDAEGCVRVSARLRTGENEGERIGLTMGDQGDAVDVDPGDRIRVFANDVPPEAQIGGVPVDPYSFADFERRMPLLWLALAFAGVVLVAGRIRGLRALVGLGASVAILVFFVVPAIVEGHAPVAVALVGSLAVMLVTIPLAHGLGVKMVAACLGTAASLGITVGLAYAFSELAHLTGFASEEATFVRVTGTDVSLSGLLLAGMVIGALGVLDDLTVSQCSTVMALRAADPAQGAGTLFRRAASVGQDHVAATVNTLVLAYAGASLPILLLFSVADTPFGDAVNNEAVATEIVAILVGSIGLVCAVPITTALAALLAVRVEPPGDAAPAHAH
jgi:uncharacterized membrane protein